MQKIAERKGHNLFYYKLRRRGRRCKQNDPNDPRTLHSSERKRRYAGLSGSQRREREIQLVVHLLVDRFMLILQKDKCKKRKGRQRTQEEENTRCSTNHERRQTPDGRTEDKHCKTFWWLWKNGGQLWSAEFPVWVTLKKIEICCLRNK